MGCGASQNFFKNSRSNISNLQTTEELVYFNGVKLGQILYCKDEFVSQFTGKPMAKWRSSEIKAIEKDDNSRVQIHFIGWSESFDFWLDLHSEWRRLSPAEILTKQQCDQGLPLSEVQEKAVRHFLTVNTVSPPDASLSTVEPTVTDYSAPEGSLTVSIGMEQISDNRKHKNKETVNTVQSAQISEPVIETQDKQMEVSSSASPLAKYVAGQQIDIQDIFFKKGTERIQVFKWRKASVLKVTPTTIRIHYENWDSRYDETLHVVHDEARISGYNTMSSTPELAKLRERLPQFDGSATNGSLPAVATSTAISSKVTSQRKSPTNADSSSKKRHEKKSAKLQKSKSVSTVEVSNNTSTKTSSATTKLLNWLSTYRKSEPQVVELLDPAELAIAEENARQQKHLEELEATAEEEAEDAEHAAEVERKFIAAMLRKKLHVIEIEGDGNCLFRAVSHQLYLTEDRHEELRARCIKHMRLHKERFEMFCSDNFDDHLRELSHLGTWGDDLEIRALEEILDRIICIYSSDSFNLMTESNNNITTTANASGTTDNNNSNTADVVASGTNEGIAATIGVSTEEDLASPIKMNFQEEELLKGVACISLSYHGQKHYNSVYNELIPLPLEPRTTKLIMTARMELFNCVLPVNNADNTKRMSTSSSMYSSHNSPSYAYKSHSSHRSRHSSDEHHLYHSRHHQLPSSQYHSHQQHYDTTYGNGHNRHHQPQLQQHHAVLSSPQYDHDHQYSNREYNGVSSSRDIYSSPQQPSNGRSSSSNGHSSGGSGHRTSSSNSNSRHRHSSSSHVTNDVRSSNSSNSSSRSYVDDEYRRQMEYLTKSGTNRTSSYS